jgi:hypothetical protein
MILPLLVTVSLSTFCLNIPLESPRYVMIPAGLVSLWYLQVLIGTLMRLSTNGFYGFGGPEVRNATSATQPSGISFCLVCVHSRMPVREHKPFRRIPRWLLLIELLFRHLIVLNFL